MSLPRPAGTAYMAVKPIQGLLKKPVTAVAVVVVGTLVVLGVKETLNLMIGVNDSFVYEPTSMVTNRPI